MPRACTRCRRRAATMTGCSTSGTACGIPKASPGCHGRASWSGRPRHTGWRATRPRRSRWHAPRLSRRTSRVITPPLRASRSGWPSTCGVPAIRTPRWRPRAAPPRGPPPARRRPTAPARCVPRDECSSCAVATSRPANGSRRRSASRSRVDARPEQADALNYLGCAVSFLGDYPTAIGHLRSAVRLARESGVLVRGALAVREPQ